MTDLFEHKIEAVEDTETIGDEVRVFNAGVQQHGQRLDKVLSDAVPEFSRSYLQQLVLAEMVQVNGEVVRKVAGKVKLGDKLSVCLLATPQSQAYTPEAMPLDWVYQDEHLGVLNKPAGLVVHPAAGHWSGTLLNGLLAGDALAAQLPRAGIVHRLDKDTSGLMLIARSRMAMDALVKAIAQRQVRRHYWALAHGSLLEAGLQTVDAAIGRDPRNRVRMAVLAAEHSGAKSAQTQIRCLMQAQNISWLECRLQTGRTHQIRVHAKHLGHPLLGDAIYGGQAGHGMQRQALHAWHLALEHPVTGAALSFCVQPPSDMVQAMSDLGFNWGTMRPNT